jgi:peptidoglycan L-alanyl-D-glutamate endopeptidase CwlK
MSEERETEERKITTKFLDVSIQRINTLDTKLIASATRVFDRCIKERIPVYIVWGRRSEEQQEVMYRYGRSIPGQILTTHRPGYSTHNYGLALDFCLLFNTDLLSWEDCYPRVYWRNKWLKVVRFFEEEGWTSKWRGADFEPGHVENLMGNDLKFYYEQNGNRNKWISNIREQDEDKEFYI